MVPPRDAAARGLVDGGLARVTSRVGEVIAPVVLTDAVMPGVVCLPHGYGLRYKDSAPVGPQLNRLTAATHCDPFSRTPYHKYVPVNLRKADAAA